MAPAKKKARVNPPAETVVASDDPSVGFISFEVDPCDITQEGVVSPDTEVCGIPWLLKLKRGDSSYLSASLLHRASDSDIWSVDATFKFVLKNVDESKSIIYDGGMVRFNHKNTGWAGNRFVKWDDVVDEDKGFIKDGRITVEAKFSLTNPIGVRFYPVFDFSNPDDSCHDVVFVIEGQKVCAGKQLLAVHSPVFKAMLYGQFAEKDKKEIELKDIDCKEFIDMLNLIYPSGMKITDANFEYLLRLADRFQIKSVVDQVEQFIIASTTLNICSKLKLADDYRLVKLQMHSVGSLKTVKSITDLKKADGYDDLSDSVHATLMKRAMRLSN